MTDTAAAETAPPAAAAQVKTPKKKKAALRKGSGGPKLGELILKTVAECSVRSGMSLQAIKKALRVKGVDVEKGKFQIKQSIKRLVTKDFLVQTKGTGASGTFKIAKQEKKGNVVKKITPAPICFC
ncbi:histone H1-like [Heterodontus francisci]|uniref:histone H1-like n=1 Tax=Heterodontus francisci TaxID=7792 RepID=UPI00355C0F89